MKKTMTWVALGVVGTLTLAGFSVAPAVAQQVDEELADQEGRGPRFGGLRLVRALDLTPEQLEQIRELRGAAREEAGGVRDQVRAEVEALVPRIKDGSLAQNDLVSAHRRIHEALGKVGQQRAETVYKVYQLLTPEQREKLGELIEQRIEDGRGFGFGLFGDADHGRGHGRHGNGDGARGPRAERRAAGPQSAPTAR